MWKMGDDLKIVEVGDGLLQFKFTLESQLLWVWNNGPWCFDNHMLAVKRWEKGMTSRSVTFTHSGDATWRAGCSREHPAVKKKKKKKFIYSSLNFFICLPFKKK